MKRKDNSSTGATQQTSEQFISECSVVKNAHDCTAAATGSTETPRASESALVINSHSTRKNNDSDSVLGNQNSIRSLHVTSSTPAKESEEKEIDGTWWQDVIKRLVKNK